MKKKLLLLAAVAFASVSSFGQVVLYEPFNYSYDSTTPNLLTGKTLAGVGTWSNFSGGTPDDILIQEQPWSGNFGLPDPVGNAVEYVGSGSDLKLSFPDVNSTNSTVIYFSCLMQVNAYNSESYEAYRQVHLLNSTNNVGASIYFNRSASGKLLIGYSPADVASETVWSTTEYEFGTQHLIVVSYTFNGYIGKMWIDPVVTSTEPTTGFLTKEGISKKRDDFSGFSIQQSSNARNPAIILDEVRVAKTWHDVVGKAALSVAQNDIQGLSVYPNPIKDGKLFINSNSGDVKTVVIYNVLGKQVLSKEVTSGLVDVSTIIKGNYIMKITENGKTSTRKIVIN